MREMTVNEAKVLEILSAHKGRASAIKGRDLVKELDEALGAEDELGRYQAVLTSGEQRTREREVRKTVNHLIFDFGIPVLSDARGYYLVGSQEELEAATATLKSHALHELWKVSMLLKIAPADLIGQLTFDWLEGLGEDHVPDNGEEGLPSHLVAITSILGRYKDDPEKYAEELKVLQEKYSPLFLSRADAAELEKAQSAIGGILAKIF